MALRVQGVGVWREYFFFVEGMWGYDCGFKSWEDSNMKFKYSSCF